MLIQVFIHPEGLALQPTLGTGILYIYDILWNYILYLVLSSVGTGSARLLYSDVKKKRKKKGVIVTGNVTLLVLSADQHLIGK